MKKLLLLVMLLGVITLHATKPKYRIETWVYRGQQYYLPQQKVWYRTNYFTLPFRVWKSSDYPFQNKFQADEIIENWKMDFKAKKEFRKSKYITIN